jgi:DNA-binding transcriptional ArsR family regulator
VDELGIDVYEQKAQLFQILSHPARLQILDVLRRGEECVCHIQAMLGKRQSYVSQQLMTLRDAGLVADRRDGLYVFYRLSDPMVGEVLELVLGPVDHRSECGEASCPRCQELEPVASASEHAQSFR